MRLFRISAVCALALSACGRVEGVLTPVAFEAPPGTSRVELLVATTRSARGVPEAEMFGGERGDALAFADIAVSIPPDSLRRVGDVQWPQTLPPDPLRDFTTLRADRLDLAGAVSRFDTRIRRAKDRQVLVFVHGFNTRFEDAVYRFAQIVHDSHTDALPVLFTWPSRGKLVAYGYDHESASFSRDALERVLTALANDKSVGGVSILAHSMGNWVTLEALRQMAIRNHGLPGKIKNVMLAAPDVDFDVFQRQIVEIGPAASRFVVFVSRDDQALAASRHVWGDKPRAGGVDLSDPSYAQDFTRDRILAIDLTGVTSDDPLHHATFAQAPAVVRAIGERLAVGQPLSEGAGLGEKVGAATAGAVGAVGSVAGAAVTAPLAPFDASARDNIGEALGAVEDNLGYAASTGASVVGR
jgi:esterase/lipase superfamily enzyme